MRNCWIALLALVLLQASPAFAQAYDRASAVQYALQWSANGEKVRNPAFPIRNAHGKPQDAYDCINFVSQVLRAAVVPDAPKGAIPWFYRQGPKGPEYSQSWVNIGVFYRHFLGRHKNIERIEGLDRIYASDRLVPGDLLFEFSWNESTRRFETVPHHIMVITSVSRGDASQPPDVRFSGHTNERRDASLRSVIETSGIPYTRDRQGQRILSEHFVGVHFRDGAD